MQTYTSYTELAFDVFFWAQEKKGPLRYDWLTMTGIYLKESGSKTKGVCEGDITRAAGYFLNAAEWAR